MISPSAKLSDKVFDADIPGAPTRDGFGKGVVEAGEKDSRVVVLCADLAESTRSDMFKKRFPDRYIEMGVAEQNLATVAAGLAVYGKIPFITSYAAFSPGRNNEQIRTTASLNNVPVKVMGMHAGISVGPDGATHQQLEDIALMRIQPNMTVINPCDAEEARKAVYVAAFTGKPVYIRFGRTKVPTITTNDTQFELGKAYTVWESENPQVTILGSGIVLYNAILAARNLEKDGVQVEVINLHTIKPIDREAIVASAKKTGAVVSVEEHQVMGGVGSAIAEVLAKEYPVPQEFIGVQDRFGQSGDPSELIEHYGMGTTHIMAAAHAVIARK
jgi:transketolase